MIKDSDIMSWGKHKGKRIGDVPASYLLWFYEQDWAQSRASLFAYVAKHYVRLEKEASCEEHDYYDDEIYNYWDDPDK